MVEPISIFTISTIAFLITTFHRNFFTGTSAAYLLHVVWTMFFAGGFTIPIYQVMVNWFLASLLWAVVGWTFATLWRVPPLLNGQYLYNRYKSKGGANNDMLGNIPRGVSTTAAYIIGILAALALSHIPFELDVPNFPPPAGGVVTLALISIFYVVFYFLFRDRTEIFRSGSPRNEVCTMVFFTWAIHAFYTIVYMLFDAFLTNFIAGQWYFYISLITGAVVFAFLWIIKYTWLQETTEERERLTDA